MPRYRFRLTGPGAVEGIQGELHASSVDYARDALRHHMKEQGTWTIELWNGTRRLVTTQHTVTAPEKHVQRDQIAVAADYLEEGGFSAVADLLRALLKVKGPFTMSVRPDSSPPADSTTA